MTMGINILKMYSDLIMFLLIISKINIKILILILILVW